MMSFARRWAWAGGRKWSWLIIKPWTSAWVWALTATRKKSHAQVMVLILVWSGAWKWLRFWESYQKRVVILKNHFIKIIK